MGTHYNPTLFVGTFLLSQDTSSRTRKARVFSRKGLREMMAFVGSLSVVHKPKVVLVLWGAVGLP